MTRCVPTANASNAFSLGRGFGGRGGGKRGKEQICNVSKREKCNHRKVHFRNEAALNFLCFYMNMHIHLALKRIDGLLVDFIAANNGHDGKLWKISPV